MLARGIFFFNRPTGVAAQNVEIQKGASVEQIARQLHRERLIRSPHLLQLFAYFKGSSRHLMAGVHPFDGGMTTYGVLLELERSRDVTLKVTIPEGLRKDKIAAILVKKLDLDEQKLLALMNDPAFCKTLSVPAMISRAICFPKPINFWRSPPNSGCCVESSGIFTLFLMNGSKSAPERSR